MSTSAEKGGAGSTPGKEIAGVEFMLGRWRWERRGEPWEIRITI
jgi:hypothetical protein